MSSWRVLGLLSGTSMDGIDVAAAELSTAGDGVVELRPLGFAEVPYPPALRERLQAALPPAAVDAREFCVLDTEVGRAFADAARHGLAEFGGADLISSLGQTLYHWVEDGRARGTTQLGRPAWIAEATGLPVLADLRARDVAAGGHGAPLAGVLDALWLADRPGPVIALNIGGIANITVVGGPEPLAYDTGPGNALLDAAAARVTGGAAAGDVDGRLAAAGRVRPELLERLLADAYYRAEPPKSTGKEHFNAAYLDEVLRGTDLDGPDLLATLTELTAATVADACHRHRAREVVASGGGVRNPALLAALRRRLGAGVDLHVSDDLGLPAAGKEGYLAALLGWLTWNGLPGNVPGTTGADGPRLLGSLTPGTGPLRLPEPAAGPVRSLRITHPTTLEAE
ncbi:anhydro-N-acetylmuramic acid kinase [Saccharopolyspora sp. 6T]|uniref:anhydro-N-acetylmuramic acid kinase n=1 Tax=Saccharopolyspora sp. 6T TaxID=2877238 RepID=UPI001CD810A5|nr:anhydro-N-acetylmuramic acid kinase [Saccharopolyspora sp. 6T]MCA1188904.1 anhydro-N-acetylmuramic acid kinase [Saccharopolyspora sp. 6T]